MKSKSSKIYGRKGSKSTVMTSFKLVIHLMRNYLTLGLIDFNFIFTIHINSLILKSSYIVYGDELRAECKIVCRDLSRKIAAYFTYSSKSLIFPMIYSNI